MACYTPGGKNINEQLDQPNGALYVACNLSAPVSMCCATGPNRTYQDVCVSNGFCHNAFYGDRDQLWRESCTDPTWKDPACIKLFVNGSGINASMGISLDGMAASLVYWSLIDVNADSGNKIGDILITNCDDGSYCYGDNNRECCRQGQGVFVLNGEQVDFDPAATSSSTSVSSGVASVSTTATSSPVSASSQPASTAISSSDTAESSSSKDSGLSTGAKAGIGVGVALGVLLVAGILFWFSRGRRKARNVPEPVDDEVDSKHPYPPVNGYLMSDAASETHSELPGQPQHRYELPASDVTPKLGELSGRS